MSGSAVPKNIQSEAGGIGMTVGRVNKEAKNLYCPT